MAKVTERNQMLFKMLIDQQNHFLTGVTNQVSTESHIFTQEEVKSPLPIEKQLPMISDEQYEVRPKKKIRLANDLGLHLEWVVDLSYAFLKKK